jgi:hypothetical protein
MDMDFGYGSGNNIDNNVPDDTNDDNKKVTNLNTGDIEDGEGNKQIESEVTKPVEEKPTETSNLASGSVIEVGDSKYTVDDSGNLIDKDGSIFKEAKDVADWLKEFDTVEDSNEISIDSIKDIIGIDITDENEKPVEFENNAEGVKKYFNAVLENKREEYYEAAINSLYQRYPIVKDVLNYYVANGNSLEGFGQTPDRSNITIDDSNEAQQEHIIRTAWAEQGRKGDVNSYIEYLKSSGTLLATAKEELAGLQEADRQYKEELAAAAAQQEQEHYEALQNYWNGVHEVIKTRNIAGYQIPESIIINRNGQKLSVTPEDFFNYIYRVDQNGHSAYENDLAKETAESRRDDQILRAYLKFVGGNYSNLVNMAINKEKVASLKLKAKERNANTIRITKPTTKNSKGANIDLDYN